MATGISEVMTSHIHTIGSDQTVDHARHMMQELGIHHLPVLKGGRMIGILTARALKLAYIVDGQKVPSLKVSEVCEEDVYTAQLNESLSAVATEMFKRHAVCCIIVDDREKIVGIFTATDACRLLSELSR